jgi:hypothetical protein
MYLSWINNKGHLSSMCAMPMLPSQFYTQLVYKPFWKHEFYLWPAKAVIKKKSSNLLKYPALQVFFIFSMDKTNPQLYFFDSNLIGQHSVFGCKFKRKISSINQLYIKLELPWCSRYYNTQSFAAISYTHNSITVGDFQLFCFTYDFD